MQESTRIESIRLALFALFLLGIYVGMYWVLTQAGWIGVVRQTSPPGSKLPDYRWIEANEKVWWIRYPFGPAMRMEEYLRGYSGSPP